MTKKHEATVSRLQLIEELEFKVKDNTDLVSRRILSNDTLEHFERALICTKLWDFMDFSNIQRMKRDFVKKRQLINWDTGELFAVSQLRVCWGTCSETDFFEIL